MSFEHTTTLIIGGGSGIGLAVAHQIVDRKGNVILVGRDAGKLDRAVQTLERNATSIAADVSDAQSVEKVISALPANARHLVPVESPAPGMINAALAGNGPAILAIRRQLFDAA